MRFLGRDRELAMLGDLLHRGAGDAIGAPGQLLLVRGRRQTGKSTLVEEFIRRAGVPSLFFQAGTGGPRSQLDALADALHRSDLPARASVEGLSADDWMGALRLVAQATAGDPAVVVVDEFPYLLGDGEVEAAFQHAFDRELSRLPVLLILVGSDLAMMEAITGHGRPLGMRGRELVLRPFRPDELRGLGLDATTTLDAHLVHGGYPNVVAEWREGDDVRSFLGRQLADPTSPLLVAGERVVAREFPRGTAVRAILETLGGGRRGFTRLGERSGVAASTLTEQLEVLREAGVVQRRVPLSTRPSREVRYEVTDLYLRFWLEMVQPQIDRVQRGRGEQVAEEVWSAFDQYAGPAAEVLVRDLLPDVEEPEDLSGWHVGGWWPRSNDPEVDLVLADRPETPAKQVAWVGSVKWRRRAPFDDRDLADLRRHREHVPGAAGARLLAVSRSGFSEGLALDLALDPAGLLDAVPPG